MTTPGLIDDGDAGVRAVPQFLRQRDRLWLAIGLSAVVALCWMWVVPMARDMYGTMTGPAAWMMTNTWDFSHLALLFAMWVVMMAGMMLPSIAPVLFRHAGTNRWSRMRIGAFAGGYLLVWTGFALAATVVQRLLSHGRLLSPMMDLQSPELSGALLVLAGLYQFTPFKRACLQSCRCGARLASQPESAGLSGSFRLGVTNGLCCLGCCWALMLLLFVVGVMNLGWMIALTVLVLLEKAVPLGARSGRMLGLPIAAAGIWILIRSLA